MGLVQPSLNSYGQFHIRKMTVASEAFRDMKSGVRILNPARGGLCIAPAPSSLLFFLFFSGAAPTPPGAPQTHRPRR
jgi:hypothetical protein